MPKTRYSRAQYLLLKNKRVPKDARVGLPKKISNRVTSKKVSKSAESLIRKYSKKVTPKQQDLTRKNKLKKIINRAKKFAKTTESLIEKTGSWYGKHAEGISKALHIASDAHPFLTPLAGANDALVKAIRDSGVAEARGVLKKRKVLTVPEIENVPLDLVDVSPMLKEEPIPSHWMDID